MAEIDKELRGRLNLYKASEKLCESPRSELGQVMAECGMTEFQQLYLLELLQKQAMFIIEAPRVEATLDEVTIHGNKIACQLTPDMLGELAEWDGECCETKHLHRMSVTRTLMNEGLKQWAIALAGQLVGYRYPDGITINLEAADG